MHADVYDHDRIGRTNNDRMGLLTDRTMSGVLEPVPTHREKWTVGSPDRSARVGRLLGMST